MPLVTQVKRNGHHVLRSGNMWVVTCMVLAATIDEGEGPWKETSFEALYGKPRPEPGEWHDPRQCKGLKQNEDDLMVCDGCGKAFPFVITPAMSFNMHYGTIGMVPTLNNGSHICKEYYIFVDAQDGEQFEMFPGDELITYRSV